MAEKRFSANEHIFNEGDPAGDAYIIQSGTVEIVRLSEGGAAKLAELHEGAVFGEMGLFDNSNTRSATARAATDVVLDAVNEHDLREMIGQCPPRLVPLIVSIVDRVRAATTPSATREARNKEPEHVALESGTEKIIVSSASDIEAGKFTPIEMPVSHLPFKIGGFPKDGDINGATGNHLILPSDGPPLTVSRFHGEIAIADGKICFRDLGSRFGTIVNAEGIGRGKGLYSTLLQQGDNAIILGNKKSPYRINVRLA